jgi:hypothetical protein
VQITSPDFIIYVDFSVQVFALLNDNEINYIIAIFVLDFCL